MAVLVTQKFSQTRIQTLLSPFQASMLIHPLHQVNYCSTDLSIFEDCLRLPYSQHPKPTLKTISASQCSHFRLVGGFNVFRPIPKISLGDHKPSERCSHSAFRKSFCNAFAAAPVFRLVNVCKTCFCRTFAASSYLVRIS